MKPGDHHKQVYLHANYTFEGSHGVEQASYSGLGPFTHHLFIRFDPPPPSPSAPPAPPDWPPFRLIAFA